MQPFRLDVQITTNHETAVLHLSLSLLLGKCSIGKMLLFIFMMMFFQVCNVCKLLDGRSFCGVGNCNIFGCDCKDGCREAPNFQTCFAQCYCSVPERLKARGKYFCIRVC